MKEEVKSKSYTLYAENGHWLGQIVLTSDGMFASVTDYGNLSNSWRSFTGDFREFIATMNVSYFATKLSTGLAYIAHSKKIDLACNRYAEKILPPLQALLKKELADGVGWS